MDGGGGVVGGWNCGLTGQSQEVRVLSLPVPGSSRPGIHTTRSEDDEVDRPKTGARVPGHWWVSRTGKGRLNLWDPPSKEGWVIYPNPK